MRVHGSILLAAALGFTLLVGVASLASGSLSGPLLTVGDSWTYRTNTSIGGAFFLGGDVTVTTTGRGLQSVDGIMYDAVRFSLSGAGTANGTVATQFGPTRASGNWVLSGNEVFESAGLKLVSSVLDLEASGTLHTAPVAFPFQLSVQNTTTFRIVEDSWRFPLGIGNSSVVASRMNFSEDSRFFYGLQTTPSHTQGSLWWNVTYALETPVAVDTPAGHFDSYRFREAAPDGTYSLLYYAPATGNDARTEAYNGTAKVATSELTSYRYQALEPARFFGLTGTDWAITGIAAEAAGGGVLVFWLRIRRRPTPPDRRPSEPRN